MARNPSLAGLILPSILLLIGAYFTFTAVQGDNGLFRRIQIEAERDRLAADLASLEAETARMEILIRRLSDDYLRQHSGVQYRLGFARNSLTLNYSRDARGRPTHGHAKNTREIKRQTQCLGR